MPQPYAYIDGIEELSQRLEEAAAYLTTKRLMAEIGLFIRLRILERTSQGVDIHDDNFEPYSPEYAEFRDAAGLPTAVVDLFFTGSMLSSLTFEAERDKVTLFFQNTQDKFGGSNPEKAYFLNEYREFFGMSEDDLEAVIDVSRQHIYNALRGNVKYRGTSLV